MVRENHSSKIFTTLQQGFWTHAGDPTAHITFPKSGSDSTMSRSSVIQQMWCSSLTFLSISVPQSQALVRTPNPWVMIFPFCSIMRTSQGPVISVCLLKFAAALLYYKFTWLHAMIHCLMTAFYCGSFTLMLHNHIHNNGILATDYAFFDQAWPYILEPLMGHTWNSYFYHHVKHHHVENNGPGMLIYLSHGCSCLSCSLSQYL